ncbi:hypothetical protein E2C01_028119 [Portunus trituberculatus]|uniref:Uncharacterized protein n=1 Tax=Portunus trituberculatus TaxID=210409 RepID=A0A5B7ENH1_PORTR|nr:hypothetical protein [Portunus trituberculatus]
MLCFEEECQISKHIYNKQEILTFSFHTAINSQTWPQQIYQTARSPDTKHTNKVHNGHDKILTCLLWDCLETDYPQSAPPSCEPREPTHCCGNRRVLISTSNSFSFCS